MSRRNAELVLAWKEMAKRFARPLGPGLHVVVHGNTNGNYFFYDSIPVNVIDGGMDIVSFSNCREYPFIRDGIERSVSMLIQDPKLDGYGNVWCGQSSEPMDVLEKVEKIGKFNARTEVVCVDRFSSKTAALARANLSVAEFASRLKRLAVEYGLCVLFGMDPLNGGVFGSLEALTNRDGSGIVQSANSSVNDRHSYT